MAVSAEKFIFEVLEPRLLLSADSALLPVGADLHNSAQFAVTEVALAQSEADTKAAEQVAVKRELIVIDDRLVDYQQLLDAVLDQDDGRQFELLVLDGDLDGIAQISSYLEEHQDLSAMHILSHGSAGQISLGSATLNSDSLDAYADSLEGWAGSLTADADLLIYGCNLSGDDAGQELVSALQLLTGTDVAASEDATGHSLLCGDWDLETQLGTIEAVVLDGGDSWQGRLATEYISQTVSDSDASIKTSENWGQSFSYNSGSGSYEVDQIRVLLRQDSGSDNEITLTLREDSFDGNVLASETIALEGTSGAAWHDFDFTAVSLNDNEQYLIRIDSSLEEGNAHLYYSGSSEYADGSLIDKNGNADAGKDLVFTVGLSNEAPTTTGISDLQVAENSVRKVLNLTSFFSDDTGAGELNFSLVNNTNDVLITSDLQGSNLVLDFTADSIGVADITVRATDAANQSVDSNFTVEVFRQLELGAVQDTWLDDDNKDSNYGDDDRLVVDKGGGDLGDGRTLLQFDLGSLPSAATILSAELQMTAVDGSSDFTIDVYQLTEDWDEDSSDWRDRIDSIDWQQEGALSESDNPAVVASLSTAGAGSSHAWDISALVETWLSDPASNYGLMLASSDSDNDDISYYSSEESVVSRQPQLVVQYTVQPAVDAVDDSGYGTAADTPLVVDDPDDGLLANDSGDVSAVPAGAILNYVAGDDIDGDDNWENSGSSAGYEIDLNGSYSRIDDPANAPHGITAAWSFGGSGWSSAKGTIDQSLEGFDGPVSFELWFRPEDADGTEILLDMGDARSDGSGASLRLNGSTLEWLVWEEDNTSSMTTEIDSEIAAGGFIQAIVSFDPSDGTTSIAINGSDPEVSAATAVGSWVSGDYGTGIGGVGGLDTRTLDAGQSSYTGEIAVFRMYQKVLSAAEIEQNYQAMFLQVVDSDTISSSGASVSVNSDGTFTYDPSGIFSHLGVGESATDTFSYTIGDDAGNRSSATVEIVVTGVNETPVAIDDLVVTSEDTPVTVLVRGNDSDPEGDSLSISAYSQGIHGSVELDASGNPVYTPDADFNGSDSFTYTITDEEGGTAEATVTVTVSAVNDDPIAVDDSVTTDEDTAVTIAVLSNDADVENDTLSIASFTDGAFGSVSDDGSGNLIYTPDSNFNGNDSFTYTLSDGQGGSASATVMVTVDAVNDAPLSTDDSVTTAEDTAVTIAVRGNDSDPDGDALSIDSFGQGTHGSVTTDGSNNLVYTPNSGFFGSDSFTYSVTDGLLASAPATVTVTITAVNDDPVAVEDAVTTAEDTSVTIDVRLNDTDPDSDPLSVDTFSQGSHGTVSLDVPSGNLIYTPDANFNGSDSFTYRVTDGSDFSNSATVTVTVTAANDAPVALGDSAVTDEDTAVTIAVRANDSDVDGDTLSVTILTQGANGSVVLDGLGNPVYTPDVDFNGSDSFTYRVSDGQGGIAEATVNITINAVNDAPNAVDDTIATAEDQPVTIAVRANDSDQEGDPLTVTSYSHGSHGSVALDGSGNPVYTPDSNFYGSDSFTYTISDGQGGSTSATVSVTINAVNDDPIAIDDTQTTTEDTAVVIAVRANDSDTEGDNLSVDSVTQGSHGSVAINADGNPVYTPYADFSGSDSFTYTLVDNQGGSAVATVTITVTAVNDAPQAIDDAVTTLEDSFVVVDVRANDSDVDGDAFGVDSATQGSHGSVAIDADGNLVYTPDNNFFGSDSFSYTIADGYGGFSSADVTVTVTEVNDAPLAGADSFNASEDSVIQINALSELLINDSDTDGDGLTLVSVGDPAHGRIVDHGDGTLEYIPDSNFNGNDSFSYTIVDGRGGTAEGVAHIVLSAVGDTPRVGSASVSYGEMSDPIKVLPHSEDGSEVASFRISAISGGQLYLADGTTEVASGDYISVAQGQAGLRFSASSGVTSGSFKAESSHDGVTVSSQSAAAKATIDVTTTVIVPTTNSTSTELSAAEELVEEESSDGTGAENSDLLSEGPPVPAAIVATAERVGQGTAEVETVIDVSNPFVLVVDRASLLLSGGELLSGDAVQSTRNLDSVLGELAVELSGREWSKLQIAPLSAGDYDLVRGSFEQIEDELHQDGLYEKAVVQTAAATSIGLSAGYVVWMLKGGTLLASMLSSMPAWYLTDPLSILAGTQNHDDEDESLESIIDSSDESSASETDDETDGEVAP